MLRVYSMPPPPRKILDFRPSEISTMHRRNGNLSSKGGRIPPSPPPKRTPGSGAFTHPATIMTTTEVPSDEEHSLAEMRQRGNTLITTF